MSAFDEWGNPKSWRELAWGDRIYLIVFMSVMWGVIFSAMFIGALILIGAIIEGQAQRTTNLESCQKHAATPYDYHQCR